MARATLCHTLATPLLIYIGRWRPSNSFYVDIHLAAELPQILHISTLESYNNLFMLKLHVILLPYDIYFSETAVFPDKGRVRGQPGHIQEAPVSDQPLSQ